MSTKSVVINSPVKGQWAIFNPPGHPKLAFDFLAVDDNKSPYRKGGVFRHLTSFIDVENTFAWSMPIYSPVDGVVIEVGNNAPGRIPLNMIFDLFRLLLNKPKEAEGFHAFGGNYVLIETHGVFVLLCHMKKGSVKVDVGDEVKLGQELGEVGNSGSSIQPHLHIQVMENKNIFPLFANLLPFRIRQAQRKDDGGVADISDFTLSNGNHYIFK